MGKGGMTGTHTVGHGKQHAVLTVATVLVICVVSAAMFLDHRVSRATRVVPRTTCSTNATSAPIRMPGSATVCPHAGPAWRTSQKRRLEPYVRYVFVCGTGSTSRVPIHLKNVTGVELWKAGLPRGEHILHDHNRTLHVVVGDTTHDVCVDEGDGWCARTLAQEIQCRVRALSSGLEAFTATVDLRRSRMRFTNPGAFSIYGGMAHVLGFRGTTHAKATEESGCDPANPMYQLTGAARLDLAGPRYVDVTTAELASDHTGGVLAQIALSPGLPIVHYAGECTHFRGFQRPRHLSTLSVSFTAREPWHTGAARLYGFNGMHWSLTLAVHGLRWSLPWSAVVDAPS